MTRAKILPTMPRSGNASVVVTVATLAFVFVEGDDLGIPHVLWSSPFFPALAEDFMQRKQ